MAIETGATVGLLLIGTELLTAKVIDANGPYAISRISELGGSLDELRIVRDDIPTIAEAVSAMASRFDYLITSGGVGPTHDDVTMEAVARALGVGLSEDPRLLARVDSAFGSRPDVATVWARMALVPEGCELIDSETLLWPVYRVRNIFVLPGVPAIFRKQLDAIGHFFAGEPIHIAVLYLSVGEGRVARILDEATQRFDDARFGSYPAWEREGFRTQVTVEATSALTVAAAVDWLVDGFADAVVQVSHGRRSLAEPL